MKITGLRPEIIAKDTAALSKLFTDLGFECKHRKNDVEGMNDAKNDVMTNAEGCTVYLAEVPHIPANMTAISINVDNLDEAIKVFEAHGYQKIDDKIQSTGTSKATSMISSDGIVIALCQHLK